MNIGLDSDVRQELRGFCSDSGEGSGWRGGRGRGRWELRGWLSGGDISTLLWSFYLPTRACARVPFYPPTLAFASLRRLTRAAKHNYKPSWKPHTTAPSRKHNSQAQFKWVHYKCMKPATFLEKRSNERLSKIMNYHNLRQMSKSTAFWRAYSDIIKFSGDIKSNH